MLFRFVSFSWGFSAHRAARNPEPEAVRREEWAPPRSVGLEEWVRYSHSSLRQPAPNSTWRRQADGRLSIERSVVNAVG